MTNPKSKITISEHVLETLIKECQIDLHLNRVPSRYEFQKWRMEKFPNLYTKELNRGRNNNG